MCDTDHSVFFFFQIYVQYEMHFGALPVAEDWATIT